MRNFIITLVVLYVGVTQLIKYLNSPSFDKYADEQKPVWVCQFTNAVGEYEIIMSRYEDGIPYFEKTVRRCPKTEYSEVAEFKIAVCKELSGKVAEALVLYDAFAEKFPNSPRARLAARASQNIRLH